MISKVLFFLFVTTVISLGKDTLTYEIKIDSILISGNTITDKEIILRELTFSEGDFLSQKDIDYNKERIYSLGLFNHVDIKILQKETNNLIILVKESWYIWPLPFITRKEKSFKKLTFGVNLQYKNFRGRNETFELITAFGYDPGFRINYFNPALNYEKGTSILLGFGFSKLSNRNLIAQKLAGQSFNYKLFTIYAGLGKRFNQFRNLSFLLGYDLIKSPIENIDKITVSDNTNDNIIKAGINFNYDTRNLKQFPDSGIYFNANFYQKGFSLDNINYFTAMLDLRNYFSVVSNLTFKWRLASRFTLGHDAKIPYYDYSYFGGDERIRGHFTENIEGRNIYLASMELKQPLLRNLNLNFKLPLIPKSLTSYRLAFYITAFADAGTIQNSGERFLQNKIYSGYGAGITVLVLPYNIARIEYAFNELKKGEVIFDLGFSF